MVTVFLTCGDRGFDKIMINCIKCQDSPLVYCLDVTPEEYFEKCFTWVCDDCDTVPPKLCGLIDTEEVSNIPFEKRSTRSTQNKNSKKKKKRLKKKNDRNKCTGFVAKVQNCEVITPDHEAVGSEKGSRQVFVDGHDVAASVTIKKLLLATCQLKNFVELLHSLLLIHLEVQISYFPLMNSK